MHSVGDHRISSTPQTLASQTPFASCKPESSRDDNSGRYNHDIAKALCQNTWARGFPFSAENHRAATVPDILPHLAPDSLLCRLSPLKFDRSSHGTSDDLSQEKHSLSHSHPSVSRASLPPTSVIDCDVFLPLFLPVTVSPSPVHDCMQVPPAPPVKLPTTNKQGGICRKWNLGKCNKGHLCRRLHVKYFSVRCADSSRKEAFPSDSLKNTSQALSALMIHKNGQSTTDSLFPGDVVQSSTHVMLQPSYNIGLQQDEFYTATFPSNESPFLTIPPVRVRLPSHNPGLAYWSISRKVIHPIPSTSERATPIHVPNIDVPQMSGRSEPIPLLDIKRECRWLSSVSDGLVESPDGGHLEQLTIDYANLELGSGYRILDMLTGFESLSVVLINLPQDTTEGDIMSIVAPFGKPKDIRLHPTTEIRGRGRSISTVRFSSSTEADRTVRALHGMSIRGSRVIARLDINFPAGSGKLRNTSVKVRWKLPSMAAFVEYSTFERACDALTKLDEAILQNRRLRVTHQLHSRQSSSGFTIRVEGLSPTVSIAEVVNLVETKHVTLGRCNYTSLTAGVEAVHRILEGIAPLERFEVQESPTGEQDAQVWADYLNPADAVAARDRLHGKLQQDLGSIPLWVQYNQTLVYCIPATIFPFIQPDLEALKVIGKTWKPSVVVRWSPVEHSELASRVCLDSESIQSLSRMKAKLEKIIMGEVVTQDGIPLWHRYFSTNECEAFLHQVYQRTGCKTRYDRRKKAIFMYGPPQARQQARRFVLEKIKDSQQHTVILSLQNRSLSYMLKRGGLKDLQKRFGMHNLCLDPIHRRLVVYGKGEIVQAARLAIHNAIHDSTAISSNGASRLCPICMENAEDPVLLHCGHAYCKACLYHYLMSTLNTKTFPLRCIGQDNTCTQLISVIIVRTLLSYEEREALIRCAYQTHVHQHPDELQYCPTSDCPQVYRTSKVRDPSPLQCPSCLTLICPHCQVTYHAGLSCKEWRDGSERSFADWRIKHGVKTCPGCRSSIERVSGCNHLTCARCRTHMCWQCMKTFPQGEGIYQHMHQEHGGIGLD